MNYIGKISNLIPTFFFLELGQNNTPNLTYPNKAETTAHIEH